MIEEIKNKITGNYNWYDIIETEGRSTPISFKDNRLYTVKEKQNSGFGLRINVKNQTGLSYTNNREKISSIVDSARAMAQFGDIEKFELPSDNAPNLLEPFDARINDLSVESEINRGREAIALILDKYPDMKVDLSISGSTGKRRIWNSSGIDRSYASSYYGVSLVATYTFEHGERLNIGESLSGLGPRGFIQLAEAINQKMEGASSVKSCMSGKVPALLTPKAFSRLLGILKGSLSARAIYKKVSPFADKLGEKVFADNLVLADRPLLPDSAFSSPFDDEGVTASDKILIDHGVIRQFVSDLKYSEKLGIAPGNASRGYSSLPSPSFSTVVVEAGDIEHSALLKNMKQGILIDQFIGLGQSNTLTGDFTANLDLAYLVENGEITGRVKDCMISDNLFDLLSGEIILSSDTEQRGSAVLPSLYLPEVNYTG